MEKGDEVEIEGKTGVGLKKRKREKRKRRRNGERKKQECIQREEGTVEGGCRSTSDNNHENGEIETT